MSKFFARSAATDARLLKRSTESLIGICKGMLADGGLNDEELLFLQTWLSENDELAYSWPGEVLYKRISAALGDGVISSVERQHLIETMTSIIGGSFQDHGATSGLPTSLPVQDVGDLMIAEHTFCFTGQFLYGTRAACEKAVESHSGAAVPRVTKKVDYLVIGTLASRDWANTSHGRKIEKAVAYREKGIPIAIIDEARWVDALP